MPGGVVVLGGGSTGEAFIGAFRRLDEETPLTLVEQALVGGECSYFACMPTKALLRPPEALAAARRVPGAAEAATGGLDVARVFWHRDQVTGNWDDSSQAEWVAEHGTALVRGEGRVVRPGAVRVAEREIEYDRLVIATGSVPSIPPVRGLADLDYWTNRDAAQAHDVPESIVVLGAGPVGCEFAQFFRRLGARVALVDIADRLLPRDDPEAGTLLREAFEREGITVHVGVEISRADPGFRLTLADGTTIEAERLLVATGRKAKVENLGLQHLDLEISRRGIEVDERMRAADAVWAIGDVTGIAMFTHAGKYQARIAAGDMAGVDVRADHRAIPAVTFTDPQVGTVGRTTGDGLVSSTWKVDSTPRASTYERPKRPGLVKVFADVDRAVLAGAIAVGPEAGEWLGQLTLAVKAEIPIAVLRDTIQPYPTFSEAVHFAVRDLPL